MIGGMSKEIQIQKEIESGPKNVIISGPTSMIGSRFLELANHKFFGIDVNKANSDLKIASSELDFIKADQDQILTTLSGHEGEVLIHFASFTDVDQAETQRGDKDGACWQLNVEGTRKLVAAAKNLGLKMVYVSTDFVFDGTKGPYAEVDQPAKSANEISWYGWTKLVGEQVIQNSGIEFLIVRTSYPYRAKFGPKTDFVRNIIARLRNGNLYPVFCDQFLTPTLIDNFSQALNLLLQQNLEGIFHLVDNTTLTPFEAAIEIAKIFALDEKQIKPAKLQEFYQQNPKMARRPKLGGLRNDKINRALENYRFSMMDFDQALKVMKSQIEN